jgi:hypothetical protein
VIEQFLYVDWLNARLVTSVGLAPVPFSRSAGEKLCILVRFKSPFYLESPPADVLYPRRTVLIFHSRKIGSHDFSKNFARKSAASSERSSALNQINDQDNDRNHEQQMDQSAAHVPKKTQKPQNKETHKYGPQHSS